MATLGVSVGHPRSRMASRGVSIGHPRRIMATRGVSVGGRDEQQQVLASRGLYGDVAVAEG